MSDPAPGQEAALLALSTSDQWRRSVTCNTVSPDSHAGADNSNAR